MSLKAFNIHSLHIPIQPNSESLTDDIFKQTYKSMYTYDTFILNGWMKHENSTHNNTSSIQQFE